MIIQRKKCPMCKTEKDFSFFYKCKNRKDGIQCYCKICRRKIAQKNSITINLYQKFYRKSEKYKIQHGKWVIKNIEKIRLNRKNYLKRLRLEVLHNYSGKCECCQENDEGFLTIDHINGGGVKHREKLKSGTAIYKWLKERNYPTGFRILCHNCNWSIYRNGGICCHKIKNNNNQVEQKVNNNLQDYDKNK